MGVVFLSQTVAIWALTSLLDASCRNVASEKRWRRLGPVRGGHGLRLVMGTYAHNPYVRVLRSPSGTGAPVTRPVASAAAMACSSMLIGERSCSSAARSRSSNSGVTCQIVP